MKSLYATEIKADAHPEVKQLLWFVFAGTKGGIARIKITLILKDNPSNANKLSRELGLDYKAIRHHLKVLEKNNLVTKLGENYGTTYFLSSLLESNIVVYDEIITKMKESVKENFLGGVE